MKKFNFKNALCGFMAGVIAATAVPVFAYNGTKTLSATFKNIKIYVDGAELTPRDSAGNVLEPFIYDGSTYLPIRAVGEAVGKTVSYDANTNSVYLGSGSGSSSSSTSSVVTRGTKLEPYKTDSAYIKNVTMGGVTYDDALWLDSGTGSGTAYYNLNGAYTSISGVYGFDDGANEGNTATISFYGDGILLQKLNVDAADLPKNFTVNLTGVSQLIIEGAHVEDTLNNWVALGDVSFK